MSLMKAISKARFDSLAGYSRSPMMPLYATELAWFQEGDERVLGLVVMDLQDNDYAYYTLGRDGTGKFRAVTIDVSIATEGEATDLLAKRLAEQAALPPEAFVQGDEKGKPLDFFKPLGDPTRLNPIFTQLATKKGNSPARDLLVAMMYYFRDVDGNFVQQFQTTGIDSRLWELYLYATFTEIGYGLIRDKPVPDFHCKGLRGEFFVEAVTVNPSVPVVALTAENEDAYFDNYVPMKFSSALTTKLAGEYWKHQHVAGHPLLFAIQDFHAQGSMIWSSTALVEYLYGVHQREELTPDGKIEVMSEKLPDYQWGNKDPIPAGFFLLPNSENVSAVMANPSGTIVKFNRMGYLAGFGDQNIRMLRKGTCYRNGQPPEDFLDEVHGNGYSETWEEGLSIYHNPNALVPLDPISFPNSAHFTFESGRIIINVPDYHPISSFTHIIDPV